MMIYLFYELYELTNQIYMNFMNFIKNIKGSLMFFKRQSLAVSLNTFEGS
jgi:hypothetical protein